MGQSDTIIIQYACCEFTIDFSNSAGGHHNDICVFVQKNVLCQKKWYQNDRDRHDSICIVCKSDLFYVTKRILNYDGPSAGDKMGACPLAGVGRGHEHPKRGG